LSNFSNLIQQQGLFDGGWPLRGVKPSFDEVKTRQPLVVAGLMHIVFLLSSQQIKYINLQIHNFPMQTMEMVVYILIAVIAGGIMLKLFVDINYDESAKHVDETIRPDEEEKFQLTKKQFYPELLKRWELCGLGTINQTSSVYVKDSGNITHDDIMNYINKYNHEDLIKGQDLNTSVMNLPTIIQIKCLNNRLILKGG